ncbi:hypothetical protein [Bdellovibrio sp. HCB274]|uniref:hypothetical protein n=1 Tax=Bdellovibrio sp. HCB274 TaxID=3394361 RepID=UPI0039B3A159
MKHLVVGLLVLGMSSMSMAAGLNCKNEAAGYALTQVIAEMIKAEKSISNYKFKADRPVTDDAIELKDGSVREYYDVSVMVYQGDSELELPADRTVRVQILNANSGSCLVEKISKSDGE